ncbi:MAG: hypothetical protein VYD21_00640 [Candidatus Thermoplasmatota archaeon]|nr:hypothetical protein [Candidatus Thermoplasmatota archaeon]
MSRTSWQVLAAKNRMLLQTRRRRWKMHPVDILPIAFAAIVFGVLVLNLGYGYLRARFLN